MKLFFFAKKRSLYTYKEHSSPFCIYIHIDIHISL